MEIGTYLKGLRGRRRDPIEKRQLVGHVQEQRQEQAELENGP